MIKLIKSLLSFLLLPPVAILCALLVGVNAITFLIGGETDNDHSNQ